jgi:peptidyl-dipeptidase Dcp
MRRRTFLAASVAAAAWPRAGASQTMNPLLTPWTGPYGGAPPFDRVTVADFVPAADAAMAEEWQAVEALAANPAPPTFDNTIAALENTGSAAGRAAAIYSVWIGTLSTPEVRAADRALRPRLAEHLDRIKQHSALFSRVDAVYQARHAARLTVEQVRLTEFRWSRMVQSGAQLGPPGKARLAAINAELAGCYTIFAQNVLVEENDHVLYLKEADLSGLPTDLRASAATAAAARRRPGDFAILNIRSAVDPFMTYSDRRDLRERVWRSFYGRGDNGDARDNNGLITRILRLRAERAKLLGYPTHAQWNLDKSSMAGTPQAALDLMLRVWPSAIARVREEVAEMQAIADRENVGVQIAPWDYRYYAEKVRKARYDLDLNEVKPYLQLHRMREALQWVAGRLYGLQFTQVFDVPTQHPSVTVFQVRRGARPMGLWYFDTLARPGKTSGAWMNTYRAQQTYGGRFTAIVSNNASFVPGAPDKPVLISWADATTLFHEFGHALHGLNSEVTYPTLSGVRVFGDYVEFPGLLLENWLLSPELLKRFARHHVTGAPLPDDLIAKIRRASTFRQGFNVTELLASALIDMKLHLADAADIDPKVFEREELARLDMPKELAMRHRLPHFQHLFTSDSQSAGYYSYIWSEVMSADAAEAFLQAPGGLYDKGVAKRLYDHVMSVGNAVDPKAGYRAFRGRDPDVSAYLKSKGFPTT